MIQVREILKNGDPAPIEGRGRLDPDVREIAARTQVPIQLFTQCPNCSELMGNQFTHIDVDVCAVDFDCKACGRLGTIFDNGKAKYYR